MNGTANVRPLLRRLALGLVCGGVAFAFNRISVPVLSPDAPALTFGGVLVLFAFRQLGPLPGLIAAVLGYASFTAVPEVTLIATAVYAIEGLVVSRVAVRTRSLVVADVLFWLTGGVLLDFLAAVLWLRLSPGFVLLLGMTQLLNGVFNAVIAEGVAQWTWVRALLGLPPERPRAWQEVLFDRTVPLVMVPMAIIAMLIGRASHAAFLNQTASELRQAAENAERGADQFFLSRL